MYSFIIETLIVVMVLANLDAYSAPAGKTYLVKPRIIESFPEALRTLRGFLQPTLSSNERCQRYAVLLSTMTRSYVDQFKIADIGVAPSSRIQKSFNGFDVEYLRQIYIDGINKFQENPVDDSMVEIFDCLSRMYRALDSKARSFLNRNEPKNTISQYKSIMDLPFSFVLDSDAKHPTLRGDQLTDSIELTVDELFNGDANEAEARFYPDVRTEGFVQPPQQGEEREATLPPVEANQRPTTTLSATEEPTEEEKEFLDKINKKLHYIYEVSPSTSNLNDRCRAYGIAIEEENKDLDEIVAKEITSGAENNDSVQGYNPGKSTRDNFLFILSTYEQGEIGDLTWIDLVDCASQWIDEDKDVEAYLQALEQSNIFDLLIEDAGAYPASVEKQQQERYDR